MHLYRTLAVAGIFAGILAGSPVAPGAFAAASPIPTTKSGISVTTPGGAPPAADGAAAQSVPEQVGICGTAFGPPVNDGILSWNDTVPGGINVAGAADFYCPQSFTINSVDVMGYYGSSAGTATFNVTVYNDFLGEPYNPSTVCATQTAIGSPTGSPGAQQTTIPIAPCTVTAGRFWLEVQEVDPIDPWYWETQSTTGGGYDADWRDTNNSLSTPCSPGYVDGYHMQDCVFGGDVGEHDFMFVLTGDPLAACGTVDQITPFLASGFGAPSRSYSSPRGADDFTCTGPPLGSSEVRTITWKGRYVSCTPSVDCGPTAVFLATIYTDDPSGGSHEPGTQVCIRELFYAGGYGSPPAPGTFQESGLVHNSGLKTFQATLGASCMLTNGTTYWLSIGAKPAATGVAWNWERGTGAAAGLYPADYLKTGSTCNVWNNGSYLHQCLGMPTLKNLLFRIN